MRTTLWRRAFLFLIMLSLSLAPKVTEAWTTGAVDAPKLFSNFYSRAIAIDGSGNPHIAYGEDHLYYAYHDGSSWNYETVDSSSGTGQYTSIAIDSSDNVHISYYDWSNGNLMYATNASGSWSISTVDSSADVGVNSSIALDALDKVHISYYDWDNVKLKYATNTAGSWAITTVDSSADVGLYSSIAMDSLGNAHISYNDYDNGDLKYTTNASGSWVTGTVDSAGTVGLYTSIDIDTSGNAHISYYDWDNGDLEYATNSGVTPGTGNCTNTDWDCATVDSSGTVGLYSSIAMDSSANLHIGYYDNSTGDLKYATNSGVTPGAGNCTNTDWDCETVDSTGAVGLYSSIAMDSSARAHISYYNNSTGELKYATNATGSWVDEAVDNSGDAGLHTSIATDSLNNIHISYYDDLNGDLKYVTNATGSWVAETVERLGGTVGKYTSIAIDSSDNVHISYYHNANGDLKYATNATGSWVTETVDGVGTYVGSYTSIAMDSSDNVHISYYDGNNGDLKHATNATGSWVTEMVDGSGGDVGLDTSIAIDSLDKIHISYYDWDNGDLKYATDSTGSWVAETVDSQGDVGEDTSIAIDSLGNVHISYYKVSQLNLKYATNASGSWNIDTVDNIGDVGLYTSIAMDSSDNAHISYYDWDNGNLKYATNATGSWVDETVDSSGDVGLYSSIVVDSSDSAHISFYDYDNGDLKYATDATIYTLTASKAGAGNSTVTSSPGGINCGVDCSQDYISGTMVTLTPTPDAGSTFSGWSGDPDCSDGVVTVDADKTCTATFDLQNNYTLTVTKTGTGIGTVTSSPSGIDCGADCSEDYISGTMVTLTPTHDTGSTFSGWSGDPDCSDGVVTMDAGKTCTATFNLQSFALSVGKAGSCSELVTSSPTGIDCGADCSEDYTYGTVVTLTTTSSIGCNFDSWTDCDSAAGNVCTMTMDASKSVTANFTAQYLLTTYISPAGAGSVSPDCSAGCWYDSGTIVILTATANTGYEFDYWTDCDSPSGNVCTLTMDTDENVTATFLQCPAPVRILGDPTDYYSLQDAYDSAQHGDAIQSQAQVFTESLDIADLSDKSITIEGGYDCTYSAITGNTTLNGDITISNGTVTIDSGSFDVQ
ncbi:MAG: hypothetical protein ABFR82_03210 [Nitrospirota bacterium]